MTDAGTTQDYFILPAPPVGGLPISQDWLDRMNRVRSPLVKSTHTHVNVIRGRTSAHGVITARVRSGQVRSGQWFLTLLEVLNPASFIRAFTEPSRNLKN